MPPPFSEPLDRRVLLAVTPGPEFRVNTFTTNDQLYPATAMDADGDFVIVWESQGQDDMPSLSQGIYGQRYNAAGSPVGGEFLVNTTTAGAQTLPAVAMSPGGAFVVAWEGGDAAVQKGVFARRYDAAGVPQGGEFLVNTTTANQQENPTVAMDADGDFVIAWQSFGQDHPLPGTDYGVYAQRFNAAGVKQGGEFLVNQFTQDHQYFPSAGMDHAGNFVIAWHSIHQGPGDTSQVYARRYGADGAAVTGEFRVSTRFDTSTNASNPSVAMDADGDWAVAWTSVGPEPQGALGVLVKRYGAAGGALFTEVLANTQPGRNQRLPSVATGAGGDFVVVWESDETVPTSGPVCIWGQRFTAGGARIEGNFQVNVSVTGGQPLPSVATDDAGDFIAAWNTYGLDSAATVRRGGVYGRLYSEPHAPRATQVYVRSSVWPAAFLDYIQAQGLGHGDFGYAVGGGAGQLADLPWTNLNRISVSFDADVQVDAGDLSLRGVNIANYPVASFSYNSGTHTGTWTLANTIGTDKVLLDVDGDSASAVRAAGGGQVLDGEWTTGRNFPSGDGSAGGDFRFRIDVLPGNVNRAGSVLAEDFSAVKARFFRSTTNPGSGPNPYSIFHDVDGSGAILADDFSGVKARFFTTLPASEPALSLSPKNRRILHEAF